MAILTPAQLQSSNASTYTTNGTNSITGATARSFNVDFISSSITVSQTGSMSVASASVAISASYAPTVPTFPYTGSAQITGSFGVTTGQGLEFQVTNTGTIIGNATTDVHAITGSVNISGSLTITGSAYGNVVAVTVASNTASIDLAAGNFFTATLGNNATTFFNFTNVKPGLTANLILTTGTVSTASFSSNVKQPSGSSYLPSSGSGKVDALSAIAVDASNLYLVASKLFI